MITKNTNKTIHTFSVLAYKESSYLEACLRSVVNQNHKSNVIIATTTPNMHIKNLADKYEIDIIVGKHLNIGGDFDFAKNTANTPLVTVAHQDDIYDENYSEEIVRAYKRWDDASIIFPDYYEIRNGDKCYKNRNLKIKRALLHKLKNTSLADKTSSKRSSLKFGDAISCPSVTFVKDMVPKDLFASEFKANIDWFAWEKLSRMPGRFVYINKPLMGHRISDETETTKIINAGIRTKEDYEMFKKFWPNPIAKLLAKIYRGAEKSNNVETEYNA